jgi:hypothetical protein
MVSFEAFNLLIQKSCDVKRDDMLKVVKHPDLTLMDNHGTPLSYSLINAHFILQA